MSFGESRFGSIVFTVTPLERHGVTNQRSIYFLSNSVPWLTTTKRPNSFKIELFQPDTVMAEWWFIKKNPAKSLRWRHNEHDGVSNHQPHGCLLNRLFRRISKKTSKLRVTGLCAGNSPGTGEFPAQRDSYAENVSIWWRHQTSSWLNPMVMFELIDISQQEAWTITAFYLFGDVSFV